MIEVLAGDALERLRELPDESVQMCVTSPPYWGLRDYGTASWEGGDTTCDHKVDSQSGAMKQKRSTLGPNRDGLSESNSYFQANDEVYRNVCGKCGARRVDSQLGLEKTPEEYVRKMVEVFREVRRVLRKDGTCWINLGDSYNSSPSNQQSGEAAHRPCHENNGTGRTKRDVPGLKPKDLVGIPWRVAFALQADGWWLRSDIIWAKPNPMPESVTDRPTKSHEYVFLLTKASSYYYDAEAIKEPVRQTTIDRAVSGTWHNMEERPDLDYPGQPQRSKAAINRDVRAKLLNGESMRVNKRSVWRIATQSYDEAHFATFPEEIPKLCIMAGSRVGDTILDPFAGSGTTGMVALELGRKAVLIELNPKYVALIEQRCDVTMGLALA